MASFKCKLKRIRSSNGDNYINNGELPLKMKLCDKYVKRDNIDKSQRMTKNIIDDEVNTIESTQSTICDEVEVANNTSNYSLLNRTEEFKEIMKHLQLDTNPRSFRDDENLLNYCFLTSKPSRNNAIGFTFHVAMENIVTGRPRILSRTMSIAIEYLCCTRFPDKMIYGESKSVSPFIAKPFKEDSNMFLRGFPLLRSLKEKKECSDLLIVLDMDETLVHCTNEPIRGNIKPDLLVNISTFESPWTVYFRPFLKLFLNCASKIGNICIFTASTREYAEQVINSIDPNNNLIKYRLFREDCTIYNNGYMKDLRIIKGANLNRTVLVDNSLISNTLQLDNAIPVDSWYGCPKDNELLRVLILLNRLQFLSDVRPYLANRYGIREWINMNRIRDSLRPI
ncbi:NLI interacting factor CTD-like phosphatase [Cryptosporidium ryanae]|uniref:NLI interacting factor CTD-like phosphatase n=1 Tax=Cryptosporidium ryanae TaxID=515981 RepID=UPI00351A7F43|nr:NLI interacting factor CTD-like phosphatase [Cryptosporidium ryanae]